MVWVIFLFIWSIPMLIIEYAVGRFTKKSTIVSFQRMIGVENMWGGAWIALVTLGIAWVNSPCFWPLPIEGCFLHHNFHFILSASTCMLVFLYQYRIKKKNKNNSMDKQFVFLFCMMRIGFTFMYALIHGKKYDGLHCFTILNLGVNWLQI